MLSGKSEVIKTTPVREVVRLSSGPRGKALPIIIPLQTIVTKLSLVFIFGVLETLHKSMGMWSGLVSSGGRGTWGEGGGWEHGGREGRGTWGIEGEGNMGEGGERGGGGEAIMFHLPLSLSL